MKLRISVITIGVDDLKRALEFYRDGLGLPTEGIVGEEFDNRVIAFFDLQQGLKLAVWKRQDIAHETKVSIGPPNATEFTLGHNVNSKAEVDAVMIQAEQAGALIADPAHDTFWGGYSGHFQEPGRPFMGSCLEPCMERSGLIPV